MDINLTNKNAIVCGASKGIGHAIAIELARLGAQLTLLARNEDSLKEAVEELDTSAKQVHDFIAVDFSKSSVLKNTIRTHLENTGIAYHILINNTGGPPPGPINEATEEQFLSAMTSHLLGNHILATALIPGMQKENYGRIINVISTSVKIPIAGLGVSNTTRGAVASWAKTMANELSEHGITVNNILPGMTMTERLQELIELKAKKADVTFDEMTRKMQDEIPMKRFARPQEIAAAAGFLASPAASYISGINVPVDGGRTGCL